MPPESAAAPLPDLVCQTLREGIAANVSDCFLRSDRIAFRTNAGKVKGSSVGPIPEADLCRFVELAGGTRSQRFIDRTEESFDWAFNFEGRRFRGHVRRSSMSITATLRLLRDSIPDMASLQLPAKFVEYVRTLPTSGIVLVGGATGSGKSTTLASIVHHFNQSAPVKIITMEDPIEFQHREAQAFIDQFELGVHFSDFGRAIRDALRENPNVILYGEMRDEETIEGALTAAETGHLVLATTHASSVASGVMRIMDGVSAAKAPLVRTQLANSLRGFLCQKLVPKAGTEERIAAFEYAHNTTAISSNIRQGNTQQIYGVIESASSIGMQTMEQHLAKLVKAGAVEENLGMSYANDQVRFQEVLRRLRS